MLRSLTGTQNFDTSSRTPPLQAPVEMRQTQPPGSDELDNSCPNNAPTEQMQSGLRAQTPADAPTGQPERGDESAGRAVRGWPGQGPRQSLKHEAK